MLKLIGNVAVDTDAELYNGGDNGIIDTDTAIFLGGVALLAIALGVLHVGLGRHSI